VVDAPAWVLEVAASWLPRERLGGAAWAELERVLSAEESPDPGPWRSIPWQVEVLEALADPLIGWVVILKGAQMGVSELIRCAIGRWALHDPGDVLWVMANREAAEKAMEKLRAMFRSTPSLRELVSPRRSDTTLLEMRLTNGMRIVIGWAGSPQSLSSDPFRRVILDEAAKYRWQVHGETNPVDFCKERTKVFGPLGLIVLLSSPKADGDIICVNHGQVLDRRVFAVPCPTCDSVQAIDETRVRWPGGGWESAPSAPEERLRLAAVIERDQSAWVECRVAGCAGRLQPHLDQWRPGAGWIPDAGAEPTEKRRAFHVPEWFHWKTTLSALVVKFLRCLTPSAIQGFYNGSLGRPWRASSSAIAASTFEARAIHPRGLVPSWATTVLATADTQEDGWWWVCRAWGLGARSRLLDWGWAEDEEALLEATLRRRWAIEGGLALRATTHALAIDSGGGMETPDGSRTRDVYRLVRRTRRAFAIKGEADKDALQVPWRTTSVRVSQNKPDEIDLHLVNKTYWSDELAALINAEPVVWEECEGAGDKAYTRQMTSEQKVLVQTPTGSRWLWQKRSQSAANHLWDCSRYQCWLAEFSRVEDRSGPTWAVRVRAPTDREPRSRARDGRDEWPGIGR